LTRGAFKHPSLFFHFHNNYISLNPLRPYSLRFYLLRPPERPPPPPLLPLLPLLPDERLLPLLPPLLKPPLEEERLEEPEE
jgi:hypothetical protein